MAISEYSRTGYSSRIVVNLDWFANFSVVSRKDRRAANTEV
jgi:hypothetical protein